MHKGCLHAIQKWISVYKGNEMGKQIWQLCIAAGVVVMVVDKTNLTGLTK
jgi:hypothetical protein